jgi:hypothetical protein
LYLTVALLKQFDIIATTSTNGEKKMKIEVNFSGKEKSFTSVEDAMVFGSNLDDGFDVWVDGGLFVSCIKNCFTGQFESEVF